MKLLLTNVRLAFPTLETAHVLPAEARMALIKAAMTKPSAADPLRRQRAIEKAIQRIKSQYPHLFQ